MNVFITGATGFLGGRLVHQLLHAGHSITALVRDPYAARSLHADGVRLVRGDITDDASVRAGMEGADAVFHVAAWYEVGNVDPVRMQQVNVDGTRIVLEAMRELAIPRGVYTSTVAVNGDTRGSLVDESYRHDGPFASTYDRTKWDAHYKVALPLMENGLPLTIVQPGLIYGPGDHSTIHRMFIDWFRGRLPAIPRDSRFSWAHVDDVARGHVLAIERGQNGVCYHLAGPDHTMVEAFDVAARLSRRRPPRIHLPASAAGFMAAMAARLESFVTLPDTYTSETLRMAAGVTYIASAEKAHSDLGWTCRPIGEGFRDTLVDAADRAAQLAQTPGPLSRRFKTVRP